MTVRDQAITAPAPPGQHPHWLVTAPPVNRTTRHTCSREDCLYAVMFVLRSVTNCDGPTALATARVAVTAILGPETRP